MKKTLFNLYAAVLAVVAIYFAVLMTEIGQMINVPRDWLLNYYDNVALYISLQILALLGLWVLSIQWQQWNRKLMTLASLGVFTTFFIEIYMMQSVFPTQQKDAQFFSVAEADAVISDDTVVYAVEIKGDAVRIFPREHLQIPHIAGWQVDGKEIVMTFCGLSNLPMVVEGDYGLGESDLNVLSQTHNNLLFKDNNHGTALQQITMQSEFTDHAPDIIPNTMMLWGQAKARYPEAQVFLYPFDRLVDELALKAFEQPLKDQFDPEKGFIFPTLSLADNRMNHKAMIYGYDNGTEAVAIHPDFAKANNGYQFELGPDSLMISADDDGVVRLLNAQTGEQLATHNGIFFGIWSHWFPHTQVIM
ncbi:DUF3179 domain-containing (seleno)protein [Oceanicoccus sagamiensis]|uniref:DUF3179 domain-containing protein n=1 Tax=Oceanicoccus sagamiensis TaxID=716816 RepID=A0A1X9N4Y8_9GAMM|nr:DUF3179 domain-containing (seleno)protein [Oceanicoccus sagamiensis]ARN73180.1 hypothetical protein BST96_03105 [Oceanicoccus sagamiensis]